MTHIVAQSDDLKEPLATPGIDVGLVPVFEPSLREVLSRPLVFRLFQERNDELVDLYCCVLIPAWFRTSSSF
jgi:hypothetical protein